MTGYGIIPDHPERFTRAREGPPILVHSWQDVYHLTEPATVECPDCEHRSPELDDVYTLARWVRQHITECEA